MSEARGALVAGNWKMFKTLAEARDLASALTGSLPSTGSPARPCYGLFPNAIALAAIAEAVAGREGEILVGAQNMHPEAEGAYTGEVSAEMILGAGAKGVILGHSERRHVFGETDDFIGKKVTKAVSAGLTPILCVGETLEEREAGETHNVVERQLTQGVAGLSSSTELAAVVIAYEPVWAIGTGKTATPDEGQDVQRFLRDRLGGIFEGLGAAPGDAEKTQILYGGSVKPGNAADLFAQPDIDGFLVGGASLDADSFVKICEATA